MGMVCTTVAVRVVLMGGVAVIHMGGARQCGLHIHLSLRFACGVYGGLGRTRPQQRHVFLHVVTVLSHRMADGLAGAAWWAATTATHTEPQLPYAAWDPSACQAQAYMHVRHVTCML